YNFTLTTDSPLTNVTLFIPVPADMNHGSPIISEYSTQGIDGVPADWNTTLYDTGKVTLAEITTRSISPGTSQPFTVTLSTNLSSNQAIETLQPVENGVMFRPVQS